MQIGAREPALQRVFRIFLIAKQRIGRAVEPRPVTRKEKRQRLSIPLHALAESAPTLRLTLPLFPCRRHSEIFFGPSLNSWAED